MAAMLNRIPRAVPALSVLLDDLGRPHPTSLARLLDVDARTVRRWIRADSAPRPVILALFWLTRWGQDEIDAELSDRAALLGRLADAQAHQVLRLRHRVEELEARFSSSPGRALARVLTLCQPLYQGFKPGHPALVDDGPGQQGQRPRLVQELPHGRVHFVSPWPSGTSTATTPATAATA